MTSGQTHWAVWGQLQEFWCHPAFCARNTRMETEATMAGRYFLAEPEVRDDHSPLALAVRPSHENVAWLEVTVYYTQEGNRESE